MQSTAALQQGAGGMIAQPPRSCLLLLPPSSACHAFRTAASFSTRRRCSLSHLQQQQQLCLVAAAATGSAAWPAQRHKCRYPSRSTIACRASGSEQQQPSSSSDSTPSAQPNSSSDPQASSSLSNAAAASAGADAPAAPAAASPLTVEAVQSDPAATIDAIQRLTRGPQDDAAAAAAAASTSSAGDAASTSSQQQDPQQQQQSGLDAFVAALAKAWAGVQGHWAAAVGFLAAALAAVKASLGKFPAWVAAQKLQKLQEAADAAPTDAGKQVAYLTALNSNAHPREVLARVESKTFASSPAVVVEYLKALVATERLNEYADPAGSSSSGSRVGLGPVPAPGQDHRSLLVLLKELQGLAGGSAEGGEAAPGSSLRRPLHVVLQGPGIPKASKVAGPFRALWNLFGILTLLMVVSGAWLVGSQALRSAAAGSSLGLGSGGVMTSASAAAGASAAAPSAGAASNAGPAIEPKEYKREEMPEKSIKTFADVLGCDESKAELEEVVEFLRDPNKFTRLGAKLPKGVLLTGPPGTGKTLLARAVAGEAGVPFFYRAGSEFEELYVGVGSRRMRALFAAAKKKAPCIVFIDEIDAIGGNRKHWENHSRKTLNQLLVEMDGFESNEGVIVMAATNLPETLDPALKRPGRFDRQVAVPLPDVKGRADILGHYLKDKPVAPGLDTALLARQTSGFSGADLANLVNEAALLAAKQGADAIAPAMVDYAYDKVLMGVERKSAVRSPEALKRTAYHEGGHALVALAVPGASPVHKATIVPRGHALGMVTQVGREDEFSINRQQMVARILVSMGGTVAEELVFGRDQVSSGATDDLRQATNMARHMVMQCGLNDAVGPVFIEDGDMKGLSEGLRQQVDEEVRSILLSARSQVKALLTDKLDQLHMLAGALLEHETLNATQIKAVLAGEKLAPALLHLGADSSSAQPDAAAASAADDVAAGATLEEQ